MGDDNSWSNTFWQLWKLNTNMIFKIDRIDRRQLSITLFSKKNLQHVILQSVANIFPVVFNSYQVGYVVFVAYCFLLLSYGFQCKRLGNYQNVPLEK